MASMKSLVLALAALSASFVSAGPCAVSSSTPTSTFTTFTPTTESSTISEPSATTTTTSAVSCTPSNPFPTELNCGANGFPSGTLIDTIENIDLNTCATTCHSNPGCLSFVYNDNTCNLYMESGSLLKRRPTSVGPPWFEIECFDCGGMPTATTSLASTTSTLLPITSMAPI
ncbi:hypothetical protein B0T10DRAFT_499585 [Thelonectria olida]|uniref:Apple domain-containing protein n=1 Tax=Thelonectria olida TaxID=1576542 RepID=A0A9P9AL05_9HYPO|nr:hypothetical protein B0T10DRAFT_499585 [Thelonectria olida]